jgi:hypothetical protein
MIFDPRSSISYLGHWSLVKRKRGFSNRQGAKHAKGRVFCWKRRFSNREKREGTRKEEEEKRI